MSPRDGLTRRQLSALGMTAFLSPALRLCPGYPAAVAGSAGWLCPAAALPLALMLCLALGAVLKRRRPGEGLDGMALRALGKTAGSGLLLLYALWLTLYAGFLLGSGASRYLSTVYTGGGRYAFILLPLIMSLAAAGIRLRPLGRAAELFRPLLVFVVAAAALLSLPDVRPESLLPVTASDLLPVAEGSLYQLDALSVALLAQAFLLGLTPSGNSGTGGFLRLCAGGCVLMTAVTAAALGEFGAELTAGLPHPFFSLMSNTSLFDRPLRLSSLAAALWLLPDFVLCTLCFRISFLLLRRCTGFKSPLPEESILSPRGGRWLLWLCGAAALISALLCSSYPRLLTLLSGYIVPAGSLALGFGLPLAVLSAGKLRRKL